MNEIQWNAIYCLCAKKTVQAQRKVFYCIYFVFWPDEHLGSCV